MKRTATYRRFQKQKKEKKIKNLIENIWLMNLNKNNKWYKIMIDTPKMCNNNCCKNPRKNKWIQGKGCLTIGELKDRERVLYQIKSYVYI